MSRDDSIYLDTSGETAELVLNQPERRNAVSAAMWSAIPELLETAANDTSVRTLIIHGGEAGHFAAGADISEFETVYATPESSAQYSKRIAKALEAIAKFPKPALAAIEGACVGGGVSIATACDLRIVAMSAKFGVTPGKLGLVYPLDDIRRLVRLVGEEATLDLLYTGRIITAEEAAKIGLCHRICETGEALSEARLLAAEIARTSQWSLQATKQMVAIAREGTAEEGEALFLSAFEGEDFKEGYKAFLSKRTPSFRWRG